MKKLIAGAWIMLFWCGFAADLDLSFKTRLSGWKASDRRKVTFMPMKENGSPSVQLTNDNKKSATLYRELALEPNTRYILSFAIKGEGIGSDPGEGARIVLNAGNKWQRITCLLGNKPETGTFDWRTGEGIIDTSLFPDSKIRVELNLTGPGTVWFKELKVEKELSRATGMENLSVALKFDRKLSGWTISSGKNVAVDETIKVGAMSVRISNSGERKNISVGRTLELEPNTQYELTFYIRGEGIENGKNLGARIMLNAGRKWSRITSLPGNQPETGSFDWRQGRGIIDTSLFPDSKIKLDLSLFGKGTVWFDDLMIVKKKSNSAAITKNGQSASFHKAYLNTVRSAALVPQGVFGFFTPGEAVKLRLFIDGNAKKYEYTLTVKEDTGKTVFSQEKKPLTDEIELTAQPAGIMSRKAISMRKAKKLTRSRAASRSLRFPASETLFFSSATV